MIFAQFDFPPDQQACESAIYISKSKETQLVDLNKLILPPEAKS